jgi:mannose-6-phosphate isomerase-like protein (cupin superfamily)
MRKFKIGDIAALELDWEDNQLTVLKEGDNLLRRFGQISLQKINAGESMPESTNETLDEIWTLISGRGTLVISDLRDGSPSKNETESIVMETEKPLSILIPFGLKHSFSAEIDSEIIRVLTHQVKP